MKTHGIGHDVVRAIELTISGGNVGAIGENVNIGSITFGSSKP
jgi:hypothetical protein